MNKSGKDCKRAMRDLLRQDRINAVGRSRLNLHLRRCESCRLTAKSLAYIETRPSDIPPVSDAAARSLYDRLIPSVYEISTDLKAVSQPRRPGMFTIVSGVGGVVMAALILALIVGLKPSDEHKTDYRKNVQITEMAEVLNDGFLDRREGRVLIDKQDAGTIDSKFRVHAGTTIKVKKSSRLNFRLNKEAMIALVGDTLWSMSKTTETLIEMNLDKGRMAVEFDGTSGRILDIRTPDSLVRVRGTIFTVEVTPKQGTIVSVLEGKVEVVPLKGSGKVVELVEGKQISIPGTEGITPLCDEQRALAAEVEILSDLLVATEGRLVKFTGSPKRVNVEVAGRVLGHTPLTVRLLDGLVSYRLTAPGMEPLESTLNNEQLGEEVSFEMEPAVNYKSRMSSIGSAAKNKRSRRVRASRKSSKAGWDLVDRARSAMIAGDIPFAVDLLEQAEKKLLDDRLITALSLLAECYAAVGQNYKAADAFDRIAGMAAGTKIAQNSRYELGRLAMDQLGEFSRARAAFTAYIASPLGGELKEAAYFFLCELDGREGAHKSAIHCFNNFLRIFPGGFYEPNARLWRGALYQDVLKRWADAERDLLSFIRAKPRHPRNDEARYRIALGRYQTNDQRGAMRMIEEYLREHPDGQYRLRAIRLKRAIIDPNFSLQPELK